MDPFDYAAPSSLDEAIRLLAEADGAARPLAGGTDLIPQLSEGRRRARLVVDVKNIPELRQLRFHPAEGLTIGAAVTCAELAESPVVRQLYPAVADACSLIGSVLIQHRASLGGNLANAAPSADGVPPLIVHRAAVRIAGPDGVREMPVEDVCVGPGMTALAPGELIVAFRISPPPEATSSCYVRFTPRQEMDIAVAGAAAAVTVDPSTGLCRTAVIALSAVAPTPVRAPEAEAYLAGKPLTDPHLEAAARLAVRSAQPISDVRASADYRRHLVTVVTRRALLGARNRLAADGRHGTSPGAAGPKEGLSGVAEGGR
ncbi:MAG: xanthine dehydrogenase family protein subunit M [Firmicutes bacterium]|nr:xanthine dehydrogenase family protein subunit M [Bacillota bacterium]